MIHWILRDEKVFEPRVPVRTALQLFGSFLATADRMAGGLGIDRDASTPNGITRNGIPDRVDRGGRGFIGERGNGDRENRVQAGLIRRLDRDVVQDLRV